jgi:bifunctional non-homologous end joining protein LigD
MTELLEGLDEKDRNRLEAASHPEWCDPMLARLTDRRFSDPDWLFERKFDGERALAFRRQDEVRLLSRNCKALSGSYPELADAVARQGCKDFVVDGEVVAFEGKRTSFARLQQRMQLDDPEEARASGVAVYYYLFDLLHLEGYDLQRLPLRRRKTLLRRALEFEDPIRFTPHRNRTGEARFREACTEGWEGLIAKRASSSYRGGRSSDWLKFKCSRGQELVVGGFSAPRGSRKGFGALLLGYYEDDELRYAGKVGTGFDDNTLVQLRRRLDRLARNSSPFRDEIRDPSVTFVQPRLVAEVGFTEWTVDGRLRHPRFLGLRRDKRPEEVSRERTEI